MKIPRGEFNIFEFRWTVFYKEAGNALTKSFYKERQAREFADTVGGKVAVTSWQVRGTIIRDGKKVRVKPVFDIYQKALEEAATLREEAEGTLRVSVQDLLPAHMAKDAIQSNLPEGWTFKGAVEFSKTMGYNPNLPQVTVEFAINEYLAWLKAQVDAGNQSQNKLDNCSFFLKLVLLYFKESHVSILLDQAKVKQFCTGTDPIPCFAAISKSRSIRRKHGTESKRPWKRDTQYGVAASISAFMNGYVRGRYVDNYVKADMFWLPPSEDFDPYIMDEAEMRNLVNGAWTMAGGRHAARYILALFGGIRPYEIDSWNTKENKGSYLNLTSGTFFVHIKRKTGCREVQLPYNARLMLQILKFEGRLAADEITPGSTCYRIRRVAKHTLTYFHARLGYLAGDMTVQRKSISAKRFFELNPVKYKNGWVQDAPRHTCLDYYYYATNHDAGSTAGYAGHLQTQFFRNYKGKLREANIAAAVARFYRLMPASHLALETAKDDKGVFTIKLPAWFKIKDETALATEIESMARELADPTLISHDARAGRKRKTLNHFELIEHSWRVHYAGAKGELQSKLLHNKSAVANLARQHHVVPADQVISFPIEAAGVKFVNGYKIEVNSWRVEGRVREHGKTLYLRPVRANKEEALKLRGELQLKYAENGSPESATE